MYELVNTSLPNGLIAGTHGFATVAMTRGLPDMLRGRLETLCAYRHRESGHGPAYMAENPVNWFHQILPGGEHVAGRIAPEEFDYTGRTNRLARLLVFPRGAMPKAGAAAVLLAAAGKLSEKFEGEPRYFEPDAGTEAALKALPVPNPAAAPAWAELLGEAEGPAMARRFAAQLERSARSGGRPIYFKTSAAIDRDGTRMLSLFADLLALLPEDAREMVQFSTYSAAVSGAFTCHLKGVYDADAAFAAATAAQPWVDCENRAVRHVELLPEIVADKESAPEPSASAAVSVAVPAQSSASVAPSAGRAGLRLAAPTVPSHAMPRQTAPEIGNPPVSGGKDKGLDPWMLAAVLAAAALLVVAVLFCLPSSRKAKLKSVVGRVLPRLVHREAKAGNEDGGDKPEIKRLVPEGEDDGDASAGKQPDGGEVSAVSPGTNVVCATEVKGEKSPEPAKGEPPVPPTQEKQLAVDKGNGKAPGGKPVARPVDFASTEGKEIEVVKSYDIPKKCKAGSLLTVFYCGKDGRMTNELASVNKPAVGNNTISPKLDEIEKRKAPSPQFVVCYDPQSEKLYWVWCLDTTPCQPFTGCERWNLKEAVFGECEEFYKRWSEFAKNGFSYQVSYSGFRVMGDSVQSISGDGKRAVAVENEVLAISMFKPTNMEEINFEDERNKINGKHDQEIRVVDDNIERLENLIAAIGEKEKEKKGKKEANNSEEKKFNQAFDAVAEKKLLGNAQKNDSQLKQKAEEKKKQLEQSKSEQETQKNTELENLSKRQKELNEWKKRVREWGKFRISEVLKK